MIKYRRAHKYALTRGKIEKVWLTTTYGKEHTRHIEGDIAVYFDFEVYGRMIVNMPRHFVIFFKKKYLRPLPFPHLMPQPLFMRHSTSRKVGANASLPLIAAR